MLPAHASVTDCIFCNPVPLAVANGQVWDGLFCLADIPEPIPPTGGGGGSVPGTKYNQAPSVRKAKQTLLLAQAMREDEELIYILKAFTEVTRWH
jgi:hypothetical protein